MTSILIKTDQHWFFKAIDIILTILAWLGFSYLFITGFIAVLQNKSASEFGMNFNLLWATIDTLFIYLLVGILNAAILYAWAIYNKKRRSIERRGIIPPIEDDELEESFQLKPGHLAALRNGKVITVSNDEDGLISDVSCSSRL